MVEVDFPIAVVSRHAARHGYAICKDRQALSYESARSGPRPIRQTVSGETETESTKVRRGELVAASPLLSSAYVLGIPQTVSAELFLI